MPNYRRAFVPGGCWVFTVNLLERRQTLLVDHIDALQNAVVKTRKSYPFNIDAVVVLRDHLHAMWEISTTRARSASGHDRLYMGGLAGCPP
jgi:putative transposase